MKSIMEEASSIMEAIQKGWDRAGKPHEFSVKVFEDAQTSFFGMRTVKSAKIALFYKEGTPSFTTEKIDSSHRPAKNRQPDRSFDPSRASGQAAQDRRDERGAHANTSGRTSHDRNDRHPERTPRTNDRAERPARPERPERAPRQAAPVPQKTRELRPLADSSAPQSHSTSSGQSGQTESTPRSSAWNDEMISWVNSWVRQTLAHAGHANIDFSTESSRNLLRIDFAAPITGDEKQERILFSSFAHLIMSSLRNKFKGDLKHLKVVLNSR